MIAALPPIADHTSEELIRDDDHEWMVRTRFGGRITATRIARIALPAEAGERLRASLLLGAPLDESLPWELRRILEGHRVRASLPAEWPLPPILAAGLASPGHPFVTRAWIDGVPMKQGFRSCAPEIRDDALEQLLWLLERLHSRGVIYQDLKPDNVVLDRGGRVWLVDLESLRSAPSGAVPCTHYTPRYAAPEQLVGRSSAPASDLFAFGRLVTELTDGAPGPRWATLAAACLALDPRLRPTASEAVRWVHGELPSSAEITIRVDEPVLLPSAPPEPPAAQVPAPLPPKRRYRGLGILVGLGLLAASLGLSLADRRPDPEIRRAQAAALVEQVRSGLRDHKVIAEKNNDHELARLLVTARQAEVLDPSADALAMVALATVWSQRWHWKGAQWDPEAFAVADRVSQAASIEETPEGALARGLAAAAACRHGPDSLPRRDRWCARALSTLDRAAELGEDWLALEARWGAVMVLNTEASRALDHQQSAEAQTREALRLCERSIPLLPSAPVNGIELAEDCLWAAGVARDQQAWHRWAGWWIGHRSALDSDANAFLVRSAAPECARLPMGADGLPLEAEPGGWAAWCAELTARTWRCVDGGRRPGWCPH